MQLDRDHASRDTKLDSATISVSKDTVLPQLTIIAPGLLGGSVARAARDRGVARHIAIWARRPEVRTQLLEQSWCDSAPEELADAVAQAKLVVIASPVDRIVDLARTIGPALPNGAIVTDVGSVKKEIAQLAPKALGDRVHFVGSHPMAGSEKTGWEHSSANLFDRRTCFITPQADTHQEARETVARFWSDLGAAVVAVSPEEHDRIVAHISHLPQILASTLCALLQQKGPSWGDYAGGGLRDTTRIAASDPALWSTILKQNRGEVLASLRSYGDALRDFQTALDDEDYDAVAAILARGRDYRRGFDA